MAEGSVKILSTKILKPEIISCAQLDNIDIEQLPFIKTSLLTDDDDLRIKINSFASENIQVVFTSANAVEAIKKSLLHPPSWDIFCINGVTLEAVENYFTTQTRIISAPDALQLSELIKENHGEQELWYFCGNRRLNTIPDVLCEAGINLKTLIVYETSLVQHRVEKGLDGILFFSPSAAESFFETNVIETKTICFAFGPSTFKKLSELTTNTIIQNTNPDQLSMIGELKKYFKQ